MHEWIKQTAGPENYDPSDHDHSNKIDIPIIDVHIPNAEPAEIQHDEVPPPKINFPEVVKIEKVKGGDRSTKEFMKDLEQRVHDLQVQLEQTKKLGELNQDSLLDFRQHTVQKIDGIMTHFVQQRSLIGEIKTYNEEKLSKINENIAQVSNSTAGTIAASINTSHATIFILIGVFVGIGLAFAFVNFRKISKKKKYLVD